MNGKLFQQSLWDRKIAWDESIGEQSIQEWKNINIKFIEAPSVKIPRYIGYTDNTPLELMIFTDASAKAYGAVVYARIQLTDGTFSTSLLFSKLRLAPKIIDKKKEKKVISIPRLELIGVWTGIKMKTFVKSQLQVPITRIILWTDSECVLHWRNSSKPLAGFVENRLKEISAQSEDTSFRYIPTKENPADFLTRGLTVDEIKDNSLWSGGPSWMSQAEEEWPPYTFPKISEEVSEKVQSEMKKKSSVAFSSIQILSPGILSEIDEKRFSTLTQLLRVTVMVMRSCNRFLQRKPSLLPSSVSDGAIWWKWRKSTACLGKELITTQEMKLAKQMWVYHIQRKAYPDVFEALETKEENNMVSQLGLTLDKSGLIRSNGRLFFHYSSEDWEPPNLLPRGEYFTQLVIQDIHDRLIHPGINHTLAEVRKEYWIPHGRAEVRHVLSQCATCRRWKGGPFRLPRMPNLPKERVSRSSPFQYVGLDYLGPFIVRKPNEHQETQKVWICLFTCMAIRAVHLELVWDLTSEQFLLCLKRFISRRGKPDRITSDNFSSYKLVQSTIDKVWSQIQKDPEILNYVSQRGIEWNFITELSPWQGGFYERLVGSVKSSLRKSIGKRILKYTNLETLIVEVEAIVNSRPLTYQSDEPHVVLCPSSFLIFQRKSGIPSPDIDPNDPDFQPCLPDSVDKLSNYWKKQMEQIERFWIMWEKEYLQSLRERPQVDHRNLRIQVFQSPSIGEVVLVKDADMPRGAWKMGRIVELNISNDGEIRSAKVKLPSRRVVN
ncbi:MAG: DDE-type integrase/transposase/recombinase, partial [Gammaproteobacteria bacterium]|nr:DDE-type integrase/transposase/recombinase [Gammaproteobacteria bacterium]